MRGLTSSSDTNRLAGRVLLSNFRMADRRIQVGGAVDKVEISSLGQMCCLQVMELVL